MNTPAEAHLAGVWSADRDLQNQAFTRVLAITGHSVDWAYDVWDEVVAHLSHPDNHCRSIAAQILCNLAQSDPQQRILSDFPALLAVTRDERFVTARHCLQALWKVGVAGTAQRALLIDGLSQRFAECVSEKNCTLIRYDILQGLRNLYDAVHDEAIRAAALALMATETDLKYRKKYATLWKAAGHQA